ncbi:MAG: hypothetical protein OSA98_26655, partial [Rubripirellula sp.]|nr:hypothetical protein [Rubripirellula sp.]
MLDRTTERNASQEDECDESFVRRQRLRAAFLNEAESKGVDLMNNRTSTFSIYLFMVSMIAPLCLSAGVEVGPATPPEVRMKAWDHHVKLRESSIFK